MGVEICGHVVYVSYAGRDLSKTFRCGEQAGFGMMRDTELPAIQCHSDAGIPNDFAWYPGSILLLEAAMRE